jgi:ribonuclease BN (tRNA processing enzyme)
LGGQSAEMFERVFDLRPVTGEPFDVGPIRFEPFQTKHPGETYGLRLRADGRLAVYTSDTSMFPELVDACRDADLLICEATYVDGGEAEPGVHMWAREAGSVAAKAGVKRLVLTHILPAFDPQQAVNESAEEFDGPVEAAVEGKRYTI